MSNLTVVTGAFGYTGKYIAQQLLDRGMTVRSLTRNPASFSPFGDRVERHPLDFDDTEQLTRSLEGADTLYNTFWIRFSRGPGQPRPGRSEHHEPRGRRCQGRGAAHRAYQHHWRIRGILSTLLSREGAG